MGEGRLVVFFPLPCPVAAIEPLPRSSEKQPCCKKRWLNEADKSSTRLTGTRGRYGRRFPEYFVMFKCEASYKLKGIFMRVKAAEKPVCNGLFLPWEVSALETSPSRCRVRLLGMIDKKKKCKRRNITLMLTCHPGPNPHPANILNKNCLISGFLHFIICLSISLL
jgi:hypothetical protein